MPDHATIWRWMERDEGFRDSYARAVQTRAINHAEEISETIQQVKTGKIPPDVGRVVVDGMKWVASRLLPKVYGDKQIVEANVTHTHQLHLDALRALSARRSGNETGSIDAQVIDVAGNLTFSGERMSGQMSGSDATDVTYRVVDGSDVNGIDVNRIGVNYTTPPGTPEGGGAASASPTALHTGQKRSDPSPRTPAKRKPRAPKNKK